MEQLEFFTVPNPCVGVCSADEKGYCQGCMRKREERFNWLEMSAREQLHILKLCRQRYRRKKLGHSAKPNNNGDVTGSNQQQNLFD